MMSNKKYLNYKEVDLPSLELNTVLDYYNKGFLFTRIALGNLYQTRSLKIDLNEFKFNSENRRILKRTEDLIVKKINTPLQEYDWRIHKMGGDFYTKKFGEKSISAMKIKELLTTEHNFNSLLEFSIGEKKVGYVICYINEKICHYSYPFYDLEVSKSIPNIGLGMICKSIELCLQNKIETFYLGSVKDKNAKYKLQFVNLSWWDKDLTTWSTDLKKLKALLNEGI